jgi:hypothetical protein
MAELVVAPTRGSGTLALRSGRLPSGERVGIAFSSVARLIEAMGPDQHWIRIDVEAMKAMFAPVGVVHLQIDPIAVGARPVRSPERRLVAGRLVAAGAGPS